MPGAIFIIIGSFAPSIAGIAFTTFIDGREGIKKLFRRAIHWKVPVIWYIVALFATALIIFTAIGLNIILGGQIPEFTRLFQYGYLFPAIFLQVLLLGGPLQEEFGWRGYALPKLQDNHNAIFASAVIGILWGLWHLPLFWITYSNQFGFPLAGYLLYHIPFALLFTWISNNTNASLLLALLFHAAFNVTVWFLPILPQANGDSRVFYLAVGLFWITAIGIIIIYGPKYLSRQVQR
jgi:membrane protease YdiL (CAAX protease family)